MQNIHNIHKLKILEKILTLNSTLHKKVLWNHDQVLFISHMQCWLNIHSINVIHHTNKRKNKNHIKYLIFWKSFSHVQLSATPDWNLPGCSVHGISQARILEQASISSSRGSSWPRDRIPITCAGRRVLYHWATWETQVSSYKWGKRW